jgi:tetratricopeptide (TPR) repeat protein
MRKWMVFAPLAVLAASFIFAQKEKDETAEAWSKTAPAEDNKAFEQILEYRKRGDFERAITVAVEPVNGKQPDDFLLQTTAVTYFQRAQADQINKEKWVVLAVQYSERALQANPTDLVNVFNVGDSYMAAGMNLGKPLGCSYYEKALQAFDHLKANPALQGEWGTIEGERVLLAAYRQKLDQHMENLRVLSIKCPGFD